VRTWGVALGILAAALLAGCGGTTPGNVRHVTLALDFSPNAVHAGVLAATRIRADRRQGIDLRVRAPSASTDSLKLLAAGRADLAILDIHDLALARERGADLVGVAPIVKRPLAAVIARPEIHRPRELEGRRVGLSGLPSDSAVLNSVVGHDGGTPGRVETKTIGFSAVPSLLAGRVDAVVAFWNAEGVTLRRRGRPTREFRVDDYGAPRYPELVLTAKRSTLRRRRADVEKVVTAIEEGSRAALDDRPATVRQVARISGADAPLVRAQLDAVATALRPPLRLDRRALQGFSAFDVRFGVIHRPLDVEQAFVLQR
jgi:putative hydroxymethylpyrimidine transport system substrate-binding protein